MMSAATPKGNELSALDSASSTSATVTSIVAPVVGALTRTALIAARGKLSPNRARAMGTARSWKTILFASLIGAPWIGGR
jgi:hypothetical protein